MSLIPARDLGDLEQIGNQAGTNDDGSTRNAFSDINNVATDPTTVLLEVQKPDGTVVLYGWPAAQPGGTLVHAATGRFYFLVSLDQPGRWRWNLGGTGAVQASTGDHDIWVRNTVF